jgi:methionine-rich copper-binding protein CopC
MKKIIINTIIISLLAVSSVFAQNNTTTSNANNSKQTEISKQQTETTAVVTISNINGQTVYSETFTVDTENGSNIKLNPTSKLTKGMYIVTVVMGSEKMTQKLVVE